MANESQTLDIEIPLGALTTCPDKGYRMVSILKCCVPCPLNRGLALVTEEDRPFDVKYRVMCGVPQVREITLVDLGVAQ